MEKSMTTEEALQLIDTVLGNVSGTRADHVRIQTAMNTLRASLQPAEEDKTATKEAKK